MSLVAPTSSSSLVKHSQILLLEVAEEVSSSSVISVAVLLLLLLPGHSLFLGGSAQSVRYFLADCFVSAFVKNLSLNYVSKIVAILSSLIYLKQKF